MPQRDENGRFVSGNPGKPKGARNRAKKSLEQRIFLLVEGNMAQVKQDLKSLEPKDRIRAIVDMMKYVLPQKRAVDANLNLEQLVDMSPEWILDRLLEEIFLRQKNGNEPESKRGND